MRLRSKVVMITDADSASGQTLIRRLAAEGASGFILNSRSGSGGAALRSVQGGGQTEHVPAMVANIDLCRAAEVRALLEEAKPTIGPVDILIHNQQELELASVQEGDESLFLQVMNANAKSAFICTQAVGGQMAARSAENGKIIYISSIHAEKPTGSSFAFSVSQGAVKSLSREAALELGRHGINVNLIEFGPVEGDGEKFRSGISTLYDDYGYKVPSAVLGGYDDLADCVLYLASGESRYVSGAVIRLDGGFILHYMDHKMKRPRPVEGSEGL